MAEMSNYLENALINVTLRNTSYTSPTTVYVSLHTADPTDAGTGTEVSGGSYVRKSATFAAPSNGVSATSADVTFDQATASWGTITHIGIWDAESTGNMLYHTPLTTSKTIDSGDIFKIASGSLTVTLA
jgi:hypothetical protein